jgi:hypothetical protein
LLKINNFLQKNSKLVEIKKSTSKEADSYDFKRILFIRNGSFDAVIFQDEIEQFFGVLISDKKEKN